MKHFYAIKKLFTARICCIILSLFFLKISQVQAQTYCSPTGTYSSNNARITNVTITSGGLNNSNSTLAGGYQNFTGSVAAASVLQGTAYTFSISRTLDAASSYGIKVWIDFDNNGTFDNFTTAQGELIQVVSANTTATRTFSYTIPTTVTTSTATVNTAGTWRMRVRNVYNGTATPGNISPCGNHNFSEAEDYLITIGANTPMSYVSSTTTQNTAAINSSLTGQQVIGIQIVTTGTSSPLSATSFSFNTNGSTNATGDISNAKLYSTGTSSTFATTTQAGSTVSGPNGSFTITPSVTLSSGTNYFWLTYDINSNATGNNVVDAECTSITVGSAQTPSVTAPAGSRQIIAMSYTSSTTTQVNTSVNRNSTNQQFVGLQVVVTGASSPLSVSSIDFSTTGTTSLGDISNAKIWSTGTSSTFATTTQFGSTISSPVSGTNTVTGSTTLSSGTNYFWLTYDIPSGAILYEYAAGAITSVTVGGTPQTPSSIASASRQIVLVYCSASGSTNLAGNGYVTLFKIRDPSNNVLLNKTATAQASCCDYIDNTGVGTPNLTQGVTYTIDGSSQTQGFAYGRGIWIDYNDDATFTTGANVEQIFLPGTSGTDAFSFSYTVPSSGISLGTHRLRIRTHYNDGNPSPCGSLASGAQAMDFQVNIVSGGSPMTYTSSTTTQNNADVGRNTTNQQIVGLQVVTTGGLTPFNVTSISFNTTGSTSPSTDISFQHIGILSLEFHVDKLSRPLL